MRLRHLAVLAVLLAQAAPPPLPARTGGHDFSELQTELERQCAAGEFSGVLLVRARGRDIFEHHCGQADIINDIANTRDTRFRIFSTSKLLTALAIMRLVELDSIDLDTPVRTYIPELPPEWSRATVAQLLNHTSGIPDHTNRLLEHFRRDHPTAMRATLAALTDEEKRLLAPSGQNFAYNNFGFELLAHAAERVEGKAFAEVVRELVFLPAGMTNASIEPPNILVGHAFPVTEPGLALGYNGAPGELTQAIAYAFVQLGAGAVRATADDFARLDEALSAGRVIRPESWERMIRDPVAPADPRLAGRGFGLGVIVAEQDGVRMHGHTGGVNGFISDFERFPDQDAMMILLSNRGFTRTAGIRGMIAETLGAAGTR
jgi:D-alanyl-D-alanine carboxypeptidase